MSATRVSVRVIWSRPPHVDPDDDKYSLQKNSPPSYSPEKLTAAPPVSQTRTTRRYARCSMSRERSAEHWRALLRSVRTQLPKPACDDSENAICTRRRDQPLVEGGRRTVHESGAGDALCMERFRRASRGPFWMEAGRDDDGVYHRGNRICPELRRGGENSGQIWAARMLTGGRDTGEPRVLPVFVHHEPQLLLLVLWSDWRPWERVWIRHTHPCYGEVVSG